MIELDSILCPLDFSDVSRRALEHAVALARRYTATLTLLHVPPLVMAELTPGGEIPLGAAIGPLAREDVEARLEELAAPARGHGLSVQVRVREGQPSREILACAEDVAARLIVMGTHGRGGFERLMLGSVTEKVLRSATCPVLTVPPSDHVGPPSVETGYRRILCATDFSDASAMALEYALLLAQEGDSTLTLLHVVEGYLDELAEPGAAYLEKLQRDARERLRASVPEDARRWCTVQERVATGERPTRIILETAAELDVEVIVMGAQGTHALDRLFFGSTTHRVIGQAVSPVLTLRPA